VFRRFFGTLTKANEFTRLAKIDRKFGPERESTKRMGAASGSELERLQRLIAQANAMIAELQRRGAEGDVELAAEIEGVRDGLQRQLAALEPRASA
jgi:hypothetical protein